LKVHWNAVISDSQSKVWIDPKIDPDFGYKVAKSFFLIVCKRNDQLMSPKINFP